jgi:hypothetical protein
MDKVDNFVNDLIREAFTSGDRANTTPNSNGLNDKGGTARQMLSGEWFGSIAWPFDQTTSKDFAASAQLQADQANSGQGEGVGGAAMESEAREIVDSLLEGSPAYLYSDPNTVGYFVNALRESSLDSVADIVESVCEAPTEEGVANLLQLAEEMTQNEVDPYFVESLISLIEYITEEDKEEEEDKSDKAVDDGSQDEDSEKSDKA